MFDCNSVSSIGCAVWLRVTGSTT